MPQVAPNFLPACLWGFYAALFPLQQSHSKLRICVSLSLCLGQTGSQSLQHNRNAGRLREQSTALYRQTQQAEPRGQKFKQDKKITTHTRNPNSGLWPPALGRRATSPAASPYPYSKGHKLELVPAANVSSCPTSQRPLSVKDLRKCEFKTATLEGKARARDTGSCCRTRREHLHRKQRAFQVELSGISIFNHKGLLSPREKSGEEACKL